MGRNELVSKVIKLRDFHVNAVIVKCKTSVMDVQMNKRFHLIIRQNSPNLKERNFFHQFR